MQTKKKTARRSLAVSAVALLLSVAMLVGTTFAWFTDTVTSGTNTITAGNLDIEVSYKNETTHDWKAMEDDSSLFSSNLWEPGHTEFVTLKIENKGTLALNYKVLVTPVSEKGGVNVKGNSFKLSDYLVVKTTEPSTTDPNFPSRQAARAAAGGETGLADVNTLTQTGTMLGKTGDTPVVEYVTLVVYMPETVENEANYKTGTEPPSIDLGIKVLATQKTKENDSFGNNYDEEAVNDSFYNVGAYYDYYPQVRASEAVVADGNTVITATGKLNSNDDNVITLAKVTVPHAAVAEDATTLTVSVKPVEATNQDALNTIQTEKNNGRETANFDIKVEGIDSNNNQPISVEVFVGKGLSNVKVYHNGTVITDASYNETTGIVSFTTTRFSDFTVAYDPAAAAIGSKTYGSLQLAVDAAQNDKTVLLLKDVTEDITTPAGKAVILNLNGYKITNKTGDTITVPLTGTLTVIGNGTVDNVTNGRAAVVNNGTANLKGGAYTRSAEASTTTSSGNGNSYYNILNHGVMTIEPGVSVVSSGAFSSLIDSGYADYSSTDPRKGYVESTNQAAPTLIINGGTFSGGINTIKNDDNAILTINDGAFSNVTQAVVQNNNVATITGGTFNAGSAHVLENKKYDTDYNAGKLTVTGGTFTGMLYTTTGATWNITGGTFSSNPRVFVAIGYEVKENGAWFEVVVSCGAKTELNTEIPADKTVITSQDELNAALTSAQNDGANTLYVGKGTFKIDNVDCDGKNFVFVGAGYDKTILNYGSQPYNPEGEAGSCYAFEGSNVTFKDVTLQDVNGNDAGYDGFVRCAGLTFENCVLKSRMTYLGENGTVSFANCTFETPKYAAWIYSTQTYNFSNCLFTSSTGRFLNVYSETNIEPVINATECKFVDSSDGTDSNAVFNIKRTAKTKLTIKDCVVTGASPMYKVESENGTVVVIDSRTVYGTTVS